MAKQKSIKPKNSLELLQDPEFTSSINSYTIRLHDAKKRGLHFDYALGNPEKKICVDFIIPKKLKPEQVKKKTPNLPGTKPMVISFMDPHDISFLTGKIGVKHVIQKGEYGEGTWTILYKGKASVEPRGSGFMLMLDNSKYLIFYAKNIDQWLIKKLESNKAIVQSLKIVKEYPGNYKHPAINYVLYRNDEKIGHLISFWPVDKKEPVNLHIINIDLENERGKGYGTILMQEFLKELDKVNRDVYLHVEGRGSTKEKFIEHANRNVKFYKKFGFVLDDPAWDSDFAWSGPYMTREKGKVNKSKGVKPQDLEDGQGVKIKDIDEEFEASEGIFYHGTNVLPSIIKNEGLEAHQEDFWNMKRKGVFLTTDSDIAGKYGKHVYRIELDPDQIIYRDTTEESSWYYKANISASKITIIKNKAEPAIKIHEKKSNKAMQLPKGFEYAEKPVPGVIKPVPLVEIKAWVKELDLGKAKDVTSKTRDKWLKKIVKTLEGSDLTSRASIIIEEETGYRSGKKFLPVIREKRKRALFVEEGKELGGSEMPAAKLVNLSPKKNVMIIVEEYKKKLNFKNPKDAKGKCDHVANELYKILVSNGIKNVTIIEGIGFKQKQGFDSAWKDTENKYLAHIVVKIDNNIIDLTGIQFGSKHDKMIYPYSEFRRFWSKIREGPYWNKSKRKNRSEKPGHLILYHSTVVENAEKLKHSSLKQIGNVYGRAWYPTLTDSLKGALYWTKGDTSMVVMKYALPQDAQEKYLLPSNLDLETHPVKRYGHMYALREPLPHEYLVDVYYQEKETEKPQTTWIITKMITEKEAETKKTTIKLSGLYYDILGYTMSDDLAEFIHRDFQMKSNRIYAANLSILEERFEEEIANEILAKAKIIGEYKLK